MFHMFHYVSFRICSFQWCCRLMLMVSKGTQNISEYSNARVWVNSVADMSRLKGEACFVQSTKSYYEAQQEQHRTAQATSNFVVSHQAQADSIGESTRKSRIDQFQGGFCTNEQHLMPLDTTWFYLFCFCGSVGVGMFASWPWREQPRVMSVGFPK